MKIQTKGYYRRERWKRIAKYTYNNINNYTDGDGRRRERERTVMSGPATEPGVTRVSLGNLRFKVWESLFKL